MNFLNIEENKIGEEFKKNGFIIRKIHNFNELKKIYNLVEKNLHLELSKFSNNTSKIKLDNAHKEIDKNQLNSIRIAIINSLNANNQFKKIYYNLSKFFLDILVGNELCMQKRVNLSIQIPNDRSSLLDIHSDVWSGDSPFEVVVWIPLVNCYQTKSMYLLPPSKYKKFESFFQLINKKSSNELFNKFKNDLIYLKVNYGEILIFNQCLPHGNVVNKTKETRWSFNCRFKGLFTPYRDKKIGEFFEPITLRPISEIALDYKSPKIL
jgi:sporadic carbohydrate cluster 2OG-Fe(II) oxygenase